MAKDNEYELKYTGEEIDLRLTEVREKASRIAFKDMKAYLFATPEDKDDWLNNGVESWIDSTDLVVVGTERKIQITNVSGNNNPYFTTAQDKAEISVTFKSLERDVLATEYTEIMEDVSFTVSVDKGSSGAWNVVANDVLVKYGDTFTIDLKKFIVQGANRVVIKAVGSSTGANGQLNVTANLTSMFISPANFAWNIPFIEGEAYNLGGVRIGGIINKRLHIKVSNETGYSKIYTDPNDGEEGINLGTTQYLDSAYYFKNLEFPTAGTGVYNVELWVDASGLQSERLSYNIICVSQSDKNTAQIVAISSVPSIVSNYANNKLFEYVVYNGTMANASPRVIVKSVINQNPTTIVDEVLDGIPTKAINSYNLGVEIESEESNIQLVADITLGNSEQRAVYAVDNSLSYPPTSGYTFYLNPALRFNNQSNREYIINQATNSLINATWTKMAWTDGVDGWTEDDEKHKCLLIPARSKCVVDLSLMKSVNDFTVEFTFKVKNVADYNEPVITICDPDNPKFTGIKITASDILVHSAKKNTSNLTQSIGYQDEKTVHVLVTVIRNYKVTYGNLCQIYVNGIKSRSFEFDNDDSWNTDSKLIFGSQTADLYIYKSLAYDKGMDMDGSERNYVASLAVPAAKKAMYELINNFREVDVVNKVYTIGYDKVFKKANTMDVEMLNGAALPHKGVGDEYSAWCNVEFNFVDLPFYYKVEVWNFLLKMCKIEGQGTTSMNYWLWNLRFRIDKSDNIVIIYPDGQEVTIAA